MFLIHMFIFKLKSSIFCSTGAMNNSLCIAEFFTFLYCNFFDIYKWKLSFFCIPQFISKNIAKYDVQVHAQVRVQVHVQVHAQVRAPSVSQSSDQTKYGLHQVMV